MWYLTLHRWTGDRREALPLIPTHRQWTLDQQRAGRMIASGPTPDLSVGIMVFRGESEEEIASLCELEPLIAAGHRTVEIMAWEVHELLGVDVHP